MKQLITVLTIILLFHSSISGQRNADWEVEVPGKIQSILFQNLTGVPIIQTNEAFCGINSETKEVAWTMARKNSSTNGIIELTNDFYEVQNSPYVLISHDLIDSRDGKVILSTETDGHTKIHDSEYIPDLDAMLLRAGADKQLRLYLVDMKSNTKKWGVDIMKASGFGQMMASSKMASGKEEAEIPDISVPMGTTPITENGKILYKFRKNVAVIDAETGKLNWKIKSDPARLIPSPDNSVLMVVEGDSRGLIGGSFAKAQGITSKSMSKKAVAYDMESGKELWKIKTNEDIRRIKNWDNDYIFISDKESCNFYGYRDGKKMWKKNYSQKKISKIEKNDEGYMVYSGRKSMQIDGEGKKMWKKPKKAKRNWGSGNYADAPPGYESGTLNFTETGISFTPEPGSKVKSFNVKTTQDSRMAYDPKRNSYIVIAGRDIYIINPDKYPKGFMFWKKKVRNSAAYTTMEVRENAYFMTGLQEFAIVFPDKKTAMSQYYAKPFDKKNFLSNAASFGMAAYSAANAIGGLTSTMEGAAGVSTFGMTPIGDGTAQLERGNSRFNKSENAAKVGEFIPPARKAAFAQTRDFAYYFTKRKDGEGEKNKLLICVNKDTGEEVDRLIFDDVRPLYKVDEFERKVYYGNKSSLKVFQL